jgi:hypothetical protein
VFLLNVKRLVIRPALLQLREIWADLLANSPRKDGKLNLDALNWLNKVTLDIIGLAGKSLSAVLFLSLIAPFKSCVGFGYTFDLLHSPDEEQNDLYRAIRTILKVAPGNVIFALQLFFPIFRRIVSIPAPVFGRESKT